MANSAVAFADAAMRGAAQNVMSCVRRGALLWEMQDTTHFSGHQSLCDDTSRHLIPADASARTPLCSLFVADTVECTEFSDEPS